MSLQLTNKILVNRDSQVTFRVILNEANSDATASTTLNGNIFFDNRITSEGHLHISGDLSARVRAYVDNNGHMIIDNAEQGELDRYNINAEGHLIISD